MKMIFGEADPDVAKISEESRHTVQEKIEISGKERITPMVLTDEGKAFYFKSAIKTIPSRTSHKILIVLACLFKNIST